MFANAPVIFNVAVVAPEYTPPLLILVNGPPAPVVLNCHWNAVAVGEVTVKLVFSPAQIVCGAAIVLFAITGFTVISMAIDTSVHPPDVTILLYQVVCVNAGG